MYKKLFRILVILCGLFLNMQTIDAATENSSGSKEGETFVSSTGNEIIRLLADSSHSKDQQQSIFRDILRAKFDLPEIGRFVLGRYWRRANLEEKKKYLRLFEDSLVENYSSQFSNYQNETHKVVSSYGTSDGGYVVKGRIVRPDGPPLNIHWKIFKTEKKDWRVLDIVVNGVSMSITQRSEYANLMQQEKTVAGLLNSLEKQIKQFRKSQKTAV